MVNIIIDGIVNELHNKFGNGYKIYIENVKQGFKTPCFIISCFNSDISPLVGDKYIQISYFNIKFFAKQDVNTKDECYKILSVLSGMFNHTQTTKGFIKGINKKSNIVDDILNFKINFEVFINETSITDKMDNMKIESEVK